jgi:hypothetical protein
LPNLHELKKQIEELEAQASSQKIQEPVPSVPIQPELRISPLEQLLADEQKRWLAENSPAAKRERADAANRVSRTCSECYCVQPVINNVCSLCGAEPLIWLPAVEFPENAELDHLRKVAAEATVEELKLRLRSGWCSSSPERERVARNLLAARLRQRDAEQEQKLRAEIVPEPEQRSMADQVRDASRYCDMQIEKLDRQLAALKAE